MYVRNSVLTPPSIGNHEQLCKVRKQETTPFRKSSIIFISYQKSLEKSVIMLLSSRNSGGIDLHVDVDAG